MKNILMLCLSVFVLFRSGAKMEYKDAAFYEWHDGARKNPFALNEWVNPIIIHNEWLVLFDKNGNQIKCIAGARVEDVIGKESFSN